MSSSQKNVKGNGGAQISQNNKRQKNCACVFIYFLFQDILNTYYN